jgi:hypothetical protein
MKLMEDGWRKQQRPQLVFKKEGMGTGNHCNGNLFFRRK